MSNHPYRGAGGRARREERIERQRELERRAQAAAGAAPAAAGFQMATSGAGAAGAELAGSVLDAPCVARRAHRAGGTQQSS